MNRYACIGVLGVSSLCAPLEAQSQLAQTSMPNFKHEGVTGSSPGGISFGCMSVYAAGSAFTDYSGVAISLPAGMYLMTASQSGDFDLDNLVVGWNSIAIGTFQFIAGPSSVSCAGILPGGASPGQKNEVTLSVFNVTGSLVASGVHVTQVAGDSGGWTLEWKRAHTSDPLGDPIQYHGDFDGDGAEELLSVSGSSGAADFMTMYRYDDANDDWTSVWSNAGDPAVGDGIYPYRSRLIVGDFDGDGKDEVLGAPIPGWMTMFEFENGDWHWGWSSGPSLSAGDELPMYKKNLIVVDVDGDGQDELLGAPKKDLFGGPIGWLNPYGGWKTLFRYSSADWHAVWTTSGNPAHGLSPYYHLVAVDLDGDTKEEILGLASWATTFGFDGSDFNWMWSTGPTTTLAGWGYPLHPADRVLVGQLDSDARDEVLLLQSVFNSCCVQSIDFENGVANWRWSNFGMGFVGDWPLGSQEGASTSYRLVRAVAGQPAFLLARRNCGSFWNVSMFRPDPSLNF